MRSNPIRAVPCRAVPSLPCFPRRAVPCLAWPGLPCLPSLAKPSLALPAKPPSVAPLSLDAVKRPNLVFTIRTNNRERTPATTRRRFAVRPSRTDADLPADARDQVDDVGR